MGSLLWDENNERPQEVARLATAKGLDNNWRWGTVGLLKRGSKFPANLLQQWTEYFRERSTHTLLLPVTLAASGQQLAETGSST